MKKIILILMLLLLGGCYDYGELTDLAIVSSMFIDYKDNKYVTTVEILDTKENSDKPSYFITSEGNSFEESIKNLYFKSPKEIYLSHIYTVVVSNDLARYKMEDIYDYFMIDPDVRKDTFFVLSSNLEELISFESDEKTSLGEYVKKLVESSVNKNGNFATSNFREILKNYLNGNDILLGSIKTDKNAISTDKVYVLHDSKLSLDLDEKSILLYNILKGEKPTFLVDENGIFDIYDYKIERSVEKDSISISLKANARLYGKVSKDVSKYTSVKDIEESLKSYLSTYITDCTEYSKNIGYDIYDFDFLYYKYRPKDAKDGIFRDLDYKVSVDVKLNEKGVLLNETDGGTNER